MLVENTKSDEYKRLKASRPDLSEKNVLKNIRTELSQSFPTTIFKVTRKDHNIINVEWSGGPSEKSVQILISKYEINDIDTLSDLKTFQTVFGYAKHIFTNRRDLL